MEINITDSKNVWLRNCESNNERRKKSIVRTSTVPYGIDLGKSMFIRHTEDRVMIHTKRIRIKDNPIPIPIGFNPFVEHALQKTLL